MVAETMSVAEDSIDLASSIDGMLVIGGLSRDAWSFLMDINAN